MLIGIKNDLTRESYARVRVPVCQCMCKDLQQEICKKAKRVFNLLSLVQKPSKEQTN